MAHFLPLFSPRSSTVESLRVKQQTSSRPSDDVRIKELESQLAAATEDADKANSALADAKCQLQELQDQMRNESMRMWAEGGRGDGDAERLSSPKGDVKERRGMEVISE